MAANASYIFITPKTATSIDLMKAMGGRNLFQRRGNFFFKDASGAIPYVAISTVRVIAGNNVEYRRKLFVRARELVGAIGANSVVVFINGPEFPAGLPPSMYVADTTYMLTYILGERAGMITDMAALGCVFGAERPKKRRKRAKKRKFTEVEPRAIEPSEAEHEHETCIVCMDNRITHMFYPCMHFQCCGVCAEAVKEKECPTCRSKIERIMTPIGK